MMPIVDSEKKQIENSIFESLTYRKKRFCKTEKKDLKA